MDNLSIIFQDNGYLKRLEVDARKNVVQDKASTQTTFQDIIKVIKFREFFIAISKQYVEETKNQKDKLLIFDLQLNLIETRSFKWLSEFANWNDEYFLLCADEKLYVFDQSLQIINEDVIVGDTPTIVNFLVLPELNIGFVLESNYPKNCLHQIVHENKTFYACPYLDTIQSVNSPLNTQMLDLENKVWNVFDTCYVSKYSVELESCALYQYPLNDLWEGNSLKKSSSYDIFKNLSIIFKAQTKNSILDSKDIITNIGNPQNNEFCKIDIINTTPLTPGWSIIKHESKYYIASIALEDAHKITLANFFLIKGFNTLSFKSSLKKFKNYLVVGYQENIPQPASYVLKIFAIQKDQSLVELISLTNQVSDSTSHNGHQPCYDVF